MGEDLETLAYPVKATVRAPRMMALGGATVKRLDELAARRVWKPPRPLDARSAGAHYCCFIERLSPSVQHLVVSRWVRQTQAWWLPGRVRDLYLRVLHSGFLSGPEKQRGGWEYCPRCVHHFGFACCTAAHL